MALHTRRQLIDLIGISKNALAVYIQRNKILLSGSYIDDQIEPNVSFIRKWSEKNKVNKTPHVAPPVHPEIQIPNTTTKPSKKKAPSNDDDSGGGGGIYDLEKQQKTLAIEKIKKENELLDVKIAKAHGDNVPTDLIKPLFAQHSKSMTSAFSNASDTFLALIGKKYNITQNDVAKYRGDLIAIINQAIEDSIKESKASLKAIVDEYSSRRGVGEKI
jgi:hypothetical protein